MRKNGVWLECTSNKNKRTEFIVNVSNKFVSMYSETHTQVFIF